MNKLDISSLMASLYAFSPHVEAENGTYTPHIPSATIQTEQGKISVVEYENLRTLVGEIFKEIDKNTSAIIRKLEKQLKAEKSSHSKIVEEITLMKEENASYKENYGEYISHELLLHEMFNGGKIQKGMFLIQKNKWKHGYLKSPKHQKGVNFWLSIFRELDIYREILSGKKVALMSFANAQVTLFLYRKEKK